MFSILNADIADTLRTHIHENVQWAQDYRSAVDSVLNSPNLNDPNSPTPYIEFADASRINDGPVLSEQVSAPEIAALVYDFRATGQLNGCSSNLPRQ